MNNSTFDSSVSIRNGLRLENDVKQLAIHNELLSAILITRLDWLLFQRDTGYLVLALSLGSHDWRRSWFGLARFPLTVDSFSPFKVELYTYIYVYNHGVRYWTDFLSHYHTKIRNLQKIGKLNNWITYEKRKLWCFQFSALSKLVFIKKFRCYLHFVNKLQMYE